MIACSDATSNANVGPTLSEHLVTDVIYDNLRGGLHDKMTIYFYHRTKTMQIAPKMEQNTNTVLVSRRANVKDVFPTWNQRLRTTCFVLNDHWWEYCLSGAVWPWPIFDRHFSRPDRFHWYLIGWNQTHITHCIFDSSTAVFGRRA